MLTRTHLQNHAYANESRHTYVCDVCQLSNPARKDTESLKLVHPCLTLVITLLTAPLLAPIVPPVKGFPNLEMLAV